jgi:hypothetical protein
VAASHKCHRFRIGGPGTRLAHDWFSDEGGGTFEDALLQGSAQDFAFVSLSPENGSDLCKVKYLQQSHPQVRGWGLDLLR